MPSDPPKVKKWGKADEKILFNLIRTGAVDIDDLSLPNIEQVRQAHFSHRSSANFRRNFRDYAARLDLEESFIGARQRAAKEGELRVCLPSFIIVIMLFTHLLPRPATSTPQEKSKKTPSPKMTTSTTTTK